MTAVFARRPAMSVIPSPKTPKIPAKSRINVPSLCMTRFDFEISAGACGR